MSEMHETIMYLFTVLDVVNKLLSTVLGLPFDQD